jgi:hypothetical protein
MKRPFPAGRYRAAIETVAQTIFEDLLGLRVAAGYGVHMPAAGCTASVHFAGAWRGVVLLECSEWQAMSWTARLMSLPRPAPLEDARDGVGELARTLAAHLLPLLPPGAQLSAPSVVQGRDYNFRLCRSHSSERMLFRDPSGPFAITLALARDFGPHQWAESGSRLTLAGAGKESGHV